MVGTIAQKVTIIVESDSSKLYYTDLSQLLALRVLSTYRLNSMEIAHDNHQLVLKPNSSISLGGGINYKGIGLSLGVGLRHSSESIRKYGKTKSFDIRGSLFAKRIGGDAYFQMYKGYYNENPDDFINWDKDYYPQLPDMQTISIGASAFYVFNYKKYSNKAAYSRTQIQMKSAGSPTLGLFFNYDEADSKNGFFPSEFPDSIGADLNVTAFQYFAVGVSFGYTYTWVISKSFFLNGSVTPGGGYKDIRVKTTQGIDDYKKTAHMQLALRGSLGYENKYFYAGLTASTLIRNIKTNNYNINLATEQFRFFVGKRFNVGKKKK